MKQELQKLRRFGGKSLGMYFGMLVSMLAFLPAATASLDNGRSGTPVDLTVGYQPYYAEAWQGLMSAGAH